MMEENKGNGASADADRAFAATPSSPSVSPVPASIPSAWRRNMQMDWSTENGIVTLIYPGDLTDIDIDDVERLLDLSIRGMRRRASAIEARRAATLGAVHESAVGKAETP